MPEPFVFEGEMSVEEREGGYVPPAIALRGTESGGLGEILVEHFGENRDPAAMGEAPDWSARVRLTVEVVE
jgi:hypothetical protein